MRYSPSLGCASQLNMIEDIKELEKGNIDLLHVDIMTVTMFKTFA